LLWALHLLEEIRAHSSLSSIPLQTLYTPVRRFLTGVVVFAVCLAIPIYQRPSCVTDVCDAGIVVAYLSNLLALEPVHWSAFEGVGLSDMLRGSKLRYVGRWFTTRGGVESSGSLAMVHELRWYMSCDERPDDAPRRCVIDKNGRRMSRTCALS
jgi:hypothetical protein